jgi:hypothetical protein
MFLGHFGVAYAAKGFEPRIPLWVLFAASQLVDIGWFIFLLLGVERVEIAPGITEANALDFTHYPYTHSLVGAIVWTALAMIVASVWYRRNGSFIKPTATIGAVVLSHFWLDVFVHRPDLTIAGEGTTRLGLGVWNNIPATLTVELGMLAGGIWLYYRATRAASKGGKWGTIIFMIALTALWLPSVFGSAPPNTTAIAIMGIVTTPLIILTTSWLERKRVTI